MKKILISLCLIFLAGCKTATMNQQCNCDQEEKITQITKKSEECNVEIIDKVKDENFIPYSQLEKTDWYQVDYILENDQLFMAWPAWVRSCSKLINNRDWSGVCSITNEMIDPSNEDIKTFIKENFDVYKSWNNDSDEGLITGYYLPILHGSRIKTKKYTTPIYSKPNDLLTIDLSEIYPDLKYKRLRGKIEGDKIVPYFSREQISSKKNILDGQELFWVDNAVEAFFMEIQGSGIIMLEDGTRVPIGYADQNGHKYKSMGRALIDAGELQKDKVSMASIKNWAQKNKNKLIGFLNQNPSFVFFKELEPGLPGPIGAQAVPITAERSIAIDKKYIPLGAPVLLSTTEPNSEKPLNRLVVAQDTGGAINGPIRADYFWGEGEEAGKKAGAMKQKGNIWVLLPKSYEIKKRP